MECVESQWVHQQQKGRSDWNARSATWIGDGANRKENQMLAWIELDRMDANLHDLFFLHAPGDWNLSVMFDVCQHCAQNLLEAVQSRCIGQPNCETLACKR
eukprot:1161508-Pelagomonas_calceolata.AAC.2